MFSGLNTLRKQAISLNTGSLASRWLSTSLAAFATARSAMASRTKPFEVVKKNERVVMWKLYASFHRHNTHCSFVAVVEDLDFLKKNEDLSYNEKVLYYMQLPHHIKLHYSAGMLGFRKSNRAEYEAAYQVSTRLFKDIEEKNLLAPNDKVEVVLKDFGKGREAFSSALQGKEGAFIRPHIVRVTDNTKLKFGGARSKKLRRL
ncbi:small subunit ribosomal protein S11 [Metschnikowia aff. pulcherrima]|uniref:Small ribosomal subunit protein uS11m n=1 Tax=Metschnikowia aff. pulcherrima TaxID=2163413 RepID=A0A4P6XSV3_9ASCO|nr:small subunit ribosomal protein S11 [Metschnikowia aff. pulcherrima]